MKLLTHRGFKGKAKNIPLLRILRDIQQTNARDSSSVTRKIEKVTLDWRVWAHVPKQDLTDPGIENRKNRGL